MPSPIVTVVVPTLAVDDALSECLRSLGTQTIEQFEVIVIDNSGKHLVQAPSSTGAVRTRAANIRVIANDKNLGFGAAINQGIRASESPYVATLNDDTIADPQWLAKLVEAAEARPRAGMFASEVRLKESGMLDSAGMLIAIDGSSKQRGHGENPKAFAQEHDALCPSGSAALYRRKMLDEIGIFDEDFFLYCEDTDLGLRGRWAGWECAYVPGAIVEHRYSHSAGRATPMKAYFVERNRLCLARKNFPWQMLLLVKPASFTRYFWHAIALIEGRGKTAEYRESGHSLGFLLYLILRAWAAVIIRLPRLWRERRRIHASRRISSRAFRAILAQNRISLRKVAEL